VGGPVMRATVIALASELATHGYLAAVAGKEKRARNLVRALQWLASPDALQ